MIILKLLGLKFLKLICMFLLGRDSATEKVKKKVFFQTRGMEKKEFYSYIFTMMSLKPSS